MKNLLLISSIFVILIALNHSVLAEDIIQPIQESIVPSKATDDSEKYALGKGDNIKIQVFNEPELTIDVWLGDDGVINYPFLEKILVENMTVRELEAFITQGLKGDYVVDPIVNVSVVTYRPFFIYGEVNNAGSFPYQPGLTVRKAIVLAGGMTEQADIDNVTLRRESDKTRAKISVILDEKVFAGDVVTIPKFPPIFVSGEVKSPGSYDFTPGLTIREAVALAGGVTSRASKQKKAKVIHQNSPAENEEKKSLDSKLLPGDYITIEQSFF